MTLYSMLNMSINRVTVRIRVRVGLVNFIVIFVLMLPGIGMTVHTLMWEIRVPKSTVLCAASQTLPSMHARQLIMFIP